MGLIKSQLTVLERSIEIPQNNRIKRSGSLTKRIMLGRSTWQGYCQSPLRFALFTEPLAQAIRHGERKKTINIKGQELKLFDDYIIISPPSQDNKKTCKIKHPTHFYKANYDQIHLHVSTDIEKLSTPTLDLDYYVSFKTIIGQQNLDW